MRRIRSGPAKGKGKHVSRLTPELSRADKDNMHPTTPQGGRRGADERGQAMVEFALIIPLFLALVVGVIQFAVALNFWFDLQRLANQGARSAAVNCGPASVSQCGSTSLEAYLSARTQANPEGQVISKGNTPDKVEVCYVPPSDPPPSGWSPTVGDAVRVELRERYRLQAIVGLAKIDLKAGATMRLEQVPNSNGSTKLPSPASDVNWVLDAHTGDERCQP
jgi:hypothetical protein